MSLKTRVLLLVLALLVAGIWGVAARTAAVLQDDIGNLLSEHMSATVGYVATDIDSKIQMRIDMLSEVAQSITPALLADPARLRDHLRQHDFSRAIFPVGVFVVNKDATVIAEYPAIEGRRGGSIRDRDYIFAAMATGKPAIGNPVIGRFAKKALFTIAVPLHDAAGNPAGALMGPLYPSDPSLFGQLESTYFGKTVNFLVVSPRDRVIVSATDKHRIMQALPARGVNPVLDKRVEQGFEGAGITTNSLGVENLSVSRNMKTTGWLVVAGVSTQEAFAPIVTLKRQIYLAALLMTLVMIAILYFMLTRQLAPLAEAGARVRRMTHGEEPLAPLPFMRQDEIGRLVGDFNQLIVERIKFEESLRREFIERKHAEASLAANEELMRSTFEQAAVGIAHIAPHTYRVLMANDKFRQLLGYTREELVGTDFRLLMRPEDMPAREAEIAALMAGEIKTSSCEQRLISKDGTLLWVNRSLSLVSDAAARPRYFIAVLQDISERKQAEEMRAYLVAIVDSANDAIVSRSLDRKILFWNRAAERLFGYTADEVVGRDISLLIPPDREEESRRQRELVAQGRAVIDLETVRVAKSGRRIDVSANTSPIYDERGGITGVAVIFRDISERVRKTALIRLLESLARATNEATTPEAAMQACLERICAYGNWPLGHVALFAPGQSAGVAPASFWRSEDRARFEEFIRYSDDFSYNRPEGQFVGVAIRERRPLWTEDLSRAPHKFGRLGMAGKFGIRTGFVFPVVVGGETTGFLEFFATEARAPDAQLLAAIDSVASQLARLIERSRATAALAELNAELEMRVASRTAELETANKQLASFSYTVAHDLRTPLRAINGFSAMVLKDNEGKLDPASIAHLKRVHASSVQMGELIDDLLGLTRLSNQQMRRQDFNLSELAVSVVASLTDAQPERTVQVAIQPAMIAHGDPGLMRIVLENLIGNAWKFTAKAAAAKIEIGGEPRDGQTVYFVRDNGAGFDMDYAHKLFAPFQRLHLSDQFEGTGIGLASVKNIVQRHGGSVWIESAVDRGTTVFFTIGNSA